ncbi:MAG TPA: hypothetical protein VGO40_18030 [Longimicrobium sp.]|jgi:hypothetical protein|nr:hypothetical protein [Longimicrobium sp.]
MALPASRLALSLVTGSPVDRVDSTLVHVRARSAEAVLLTDPRGQALGLIPTADLEGTATGKVTLSMLKRRPITVVRPDTDVGLLIGDLSLEPHDAWFALHERGDFTGVIPPELVHAVDALRRRRIAVEGVESIRFGSAGSSYSEVLNNLSSSFELFGHIQVMEPNVVYRCPNGHVLTAEEVPLHYDDDGNVRCPADGAVMTRQI